MFQRRRQAHGVVLGIPAVAQHGMADAGSGQQFFRLNVLRGKAERAGGCLQQAGVDDMLNPGGLRGFDHGGMLRYAATDVAARDQQQRVDTVERRREGFGGVVVEDTRRHTQIRGLVDVAGQRDDAARRILGFQGVDNEAAKLASCAGDCNGHGYLFASGCDSGELDPLLMKSKYIHFC